MLYRLINLHRLDSPLTKGEFVAIAIDRSESAPRTFKTRRKVVTCEVVGLTDADYVLDVPEVGTISVLKQRPASESYSGGGTRTFSFMMRNPLAGADRATVDGFFKRVAMDDFRARPGVFRIESVEGAVAKGRFVPRPSSGSSDDDGEGLAAASRRDPLRLVPAEGFDTRPGDVFVCSEFEITFADGRFEVDLLDRFRLARDMPSEDVASFLGFDPSEDGRHRGRITSPGWPLACWHSVERAMDEAVARTEPDRALALFRKGYSRNEAFVLGSSGYHAFVNDDLGDHLDGQREEGLWVIDGLRNRSSVSYEGEYDAWIEGDWRPATEDDVRELHGTIAAADAEIHEFLEEDDSVPADGIARREMEKARIAHFEELFAAETRKFAAGSYTMPRRRALAVGMEAVENPEDVDRFVSGILRNISEGPLHALADRIARDEILRAPDAFDRIGSVGKGGGLRDRCRFSPNEPLKRRLTRFVDVLERHSEIALDPERPWNQRKSLPSLAAIAAELAPPTLDAASLPLLDIAPQRIGGEWRIVSEKPGEAVVALFREGAHVADLRCSDILSPEGLCELCTPQGIPFRDDEPFGFSEKRYYVDEPSLDCHELRGHIVARTRVNGTIALPVADGWHRFSGVAASGSCHVQGGVLHRDDDQPSLVRDDGVEEWYFRGHVHRDGSVVRSRATDARRIPAAPVIDSRESFGAADANPRPRIP